MRGLTLGGQLAFWFLGLDIPNVDFCMLNLFETLTKPPLLTTSAINDRPPTKAGGRDGAHRALPVHTFPSQICSFRYRPLDRCLQSVSRTLSHVRSPVEAAR